MKYFIQYPGFLVCNLRCPYCFHHKELTTGLSSGGDMVGLGGPNFSVEEYITWRDTHLKDAEEIVIHFHGGEPTMPVNINYITKFLSKSSVEKVDVLTNGLGPEESYHQLIALKSRIYRVGFTYHRTVIGDKPELRKKYIENVLLLKRAGLPIYVKEMLMIDHRSAIKANKRFWDMMSVPVKIQDFKGYVRGEDFTELQRYTIDDINLLDPEYLKKGDTCTCLPGYRQIMIRGGWMAGDVLGCWIDPVVIGNIKDNTYNPNYKVEIKKVPGGKQVVTGVPKIYKGTYEGDRYYDNLKKLGA